MKPAKSELKSRAGGGPEPEEAEVAIYDEAKADQIHSPVRRASNLNLGVGESNQPTTKGYRQIDGLPQREREVKINRKRREHNC